MRLIDFPKNEETSYKTALSKQLGTPEHVIELIDWYNSSLYTLREIAIRGEDSNKTREHIIAALTKLLAEAQVGLNIEDPVTHERGVARFFFNQVDKLFEKYIEGKGLIFDIKGRSNGQP